MSEDGGLPGGSSSNYSASQITCTVSGAYALSGGDTELVGAKGWYGDDGHGGPDSYGRDVGQQARVVFRVETPVNWAGNSAHELATCGRAGLDAAHPTNAKVGIQYWQIVAMPVSSFHINPSPPPPPHTHRAPLTNLHILIPKPHKKVSGYFHVHHF